MAMHMRGMPKFNDPLTSAITAKYSGKCPSCGKWWNPGALITLAGYHPVTGKAAYQHKGCRRDSTKDSTVMVQVRYFKASWTQPEHWHVTAFDLTGRSTFCDKFEESPTDEQLSERWPDITIERA